MYRTTLHFEDLPLRPCHGGPAVALVTGSAVVRFSGRDLIAVEEVTLESALLHEPNAHLTATRQGCELFHACKKALTWGFADDLFDVDKLTAEAREAAAREAGEQRRRLELVVS